MKEILVIRHGETDWNAQGRLQGILDTPLNSNGLRQAQEAGHSLKSQGIQCIYASPMLRARKTAEIISETIGVPLVFREDLREKDFGEMQGLRVDEIDALYGDMLWEMRSILDLAPPGGESSREVIERLEPVIEEIEGLGQRVLIVTHGAVARVLYKMLAEPEEDLFHQFKLDNCEILTFKPVPQGRYICETLRLIPSEIV